MDEEVISVGRADVRIEDGPRVADFVSLLFGEEGAEREFTRVTPMLRAKDFCRSCMYVCV